MAEFRKNFPLLIYCSNFHPGIKKKPELVEKNIKI
jgi:hypothetical protein